MKVILYLILIFTILNCEKTLIRHALAHSEQQENISNQEEIDHWVKLNRGVTIGDYFQFMDSVVAKYDSITAYKLSEHLLVRANPKIIDRLVNTDYYKLIKKDSFVYNQRTLTVLNKNDSLLIPNNALALQILANFEKEWLDINIPEFKLRIYSDTILVSKFPIRVGQSKERYLKLSNRIINLRTRTGTGIIVRHERNPDFYNPVTGKQFYVTKRDDNRVTMMPQIPWIETEINGLRNGQMIHPTTNPKTLGKTYSNGCIGTRESDAWIIYYHAPINTRIKIRYDLNTKDSLGRVIAFKDIYGYRDNKINH